MRYLLVALLVGGCGDGVDRDIEEHITIEQGVYGLLVSGCDTSGCRDHPASGQDVIVYAAGQTGSFATTTSDRGGVYQIDLPAGDYTLCTYSCTPITVSAYSTVRYDWTSGPGGGQWERR